ncbi:MULTISPECIES: helix-turn-helix domain-containing protein [Pseudomonas]|jgi:DNA-binding HxlR family transcriptional regulator|uniref:winged helix-turn-helix transcriptional regulator n=1 Tax=Pseudomonas TaxID=286 RepID=UPI0005FB5F41|nr:MULTISPECIES: helix-turn-helix domain-containing protein [Pseudomonas]KJZ35659.1 transcriptional regulator [Pseudomonas fluorescens]PWK41433.1 HxlR family transcriptional regulator [Pseudomonas sp. OV226]
MSVNTAVPETLCPISRAESVVGDRWTVLVLRELFMGSHRFDEIQAQTAGTPQMIATRLKRLEADGLVARRPYSERPLRYEYHLTPKGDAFYSVVLALRAWGETWCKSEEEGLAVVYTHATCRQPAGLGPLCAHCGEPLRRAELISTPSEAYAAERKARRDAFKGARGADPVAAAQDQ